MEIFVRPLLSHQLIGCLEHLRASKRAKDEYDNYAYFSCLCAPY